MDLDLPEENRWVLYRSEKEIENLGIGTTVGALSQGLMPLKTEPNDEGEWDFETSWDSHMVSILNDDLYHHEYVPDEEKKKERMARIQAAKKGIREVKLATYTVGSSYHLSDICEIFETLNTTGTVVSTVDLIHSFLLQDSAGTTNPMHLRDWIDDLGKVSGAEGWASSVRKPERIAQIATAAYLGLETRPAARPIAGKSISVSSIKAGDLLRTPTAHWLSLRESEAGFAATIGGFQDSVANARFPMGWCPYPASAAVYVGMAWSKETEQVAKDECWGVHDLKALFKAFFWRNALSGRYDQGFLTKVSTDMKDLREILRGKTEESTGSQWALEAQKRLEKFMDVEVPSTLRLRELIERGTATGARRAAIRLVVATRASTDLVSGEPIGYPASSDTDMHHVYPKKWINKNKTGDLGKMLKEADEEGWDRVNCAANLVPLSSKINQDWRDKNPGQVLTEKAMVFAPIKQPLRNAFMNEALFDLLRSDDAVASIREFQSQRAKLIADYVGELMTVRLS